MATSKLYDAIIIGGGPAALSIALSLSRQLYTALILDSGVYRNAPAKHMHNVPGFDHADPADFRAQVRGDLQARYPSIEFKQAAVSQVRKVDDGDDARAGSVVVFEAVDGKTGEVYRGRKLGLATGIRDVLDKEPQGYADCWGKTM
jgi:thioredoxin reductase